MQSEAAHAFVIAKQNAIGTERHRFMTAFVAAELAKLSHRDGVLSSAMIPVGFGGRCASKKLSL